MLKEFIDFFRSDRLSKYDTYPDKNFDKIEHFLEGKHKIISNDKIKSHLWSALINIIIVFPVFLILSPITGIIPAVNIVIYFLIFSAITQVGLLNSSKWLAIKSNKIRVLSKDTVKNDTERQLLRIIEKISKIAGLANSPDVGIWRSEEMNAFATGRDRNNAIIAFSSSLIYHMDEDAIAAVAAHELSHIVTGDMKTSTIVQSAMDAIIVFFLYRLHCLFQR
ncbi:MAG: hypothetical protein D3905_14140 [Candidatus Electrothrix sp. AS4_5]|nr:hypothetical protein [Candidatus Electrothrix gigas]